MRIEVLDGLERRRRWSQDDKARIDKLLDYDCSWAASGIGRFRVNIMKQRGSFSIIMRVIPWEVPTFEKLGLPPVLGTIASASKRKTSRSKSISASPQRPISTR